MAKVKFDVKRAATRLKKEIDKVIENPVLERDFGTFLTERIRFEARRGKPLNDERKFPPLSDATKRIRDQLSEVNRTHPAFSSNKSNLTFTGQLQDALSFRKTRKGVFEIFVKDSSRRAIRGSGDFGDTNADVDRKLRRGVKSRQFGVRRFILFSNKGLKSDRKIPKRLRQILLRFLRRQLRRS